MFPKNINSIYYSFRPFEVAILGKKETNLNIKDKAFLCVFLYSFDKCLWSIHSVISAALGTVDMEVNKIGICTREVRVY